MEKDTMSLRRIFGLILLFLFFEVVVAVLSAILLPDTSVLVACTVLTALALAVWVVGMLVTRKVSKSAAPPVDAPVPAPTPKASDSPFTQELKKLVADANNRLAGAPIAANSGVKPLVTNLPLYLVVGPPGSGKTSMIANSGLEPRMLAGEAFRESRIIPTVSCNFWFASGAIFVDVSGQAFLDEPEHWESLLRLLSGREWKPLWRRIFSRNQARQNLRGALLVYDTKNFLDGGNAEISSAAARKIHERLQTAGSIFGADFPVYTLFSNVDDIRYATEFFAHLSETEEQRTVGATLPLLDRHPHAREVYAEAENKRLTSYFNRLCASLASKRMTMLGRESFLDRKSFIFEFPREMKRIRSDLVQFLVDICRPNPLQRGPRLRGFYFSGIRQAAREMAIHEIPGDAALAQMESEATYFFGSRTPITTAAALTSAMPSAPTVMRWSFLSEVFGKVILPDHAAQRTVVDHRVELYRNIVLGTAAFLLLFLTLAWTVSWSRNRQLLNTATASLATFSDTQPGPPSVESLQQLDGLRRTLEDLRSYEDGHPPLGMRWGLYSGDRVIADLRSVYFARFRKIFLDPILGTFVAGFSQLQPSTTTIAYSDAYNRLRVYRTIINCKCRPDKPLLDRTLPAMLPANGTLSPEAVRLANLQIGFYTSELLRANPYDGQITEDENAVKHAQAYLLAFKGPDRLLRGVLDRVNREHEALALARYAPNYRDVLNGPERIEWAYTKEGRELVLKRIRDREFVASGEPCVIGLNAAAAGATNWLPGNDSGTEVVEELYVKDYIQRWKQFLAAFSVLPYRNPQDASGKLSILSDGNRSPLLAMLFMVSSNTWLQAPQPAADSQSKKAATAAADRAAERGLNRWFPRLQRGRNTVREFVPPASASPPPPERATIADIARAFQPAWSAVDPKNPESFSGPSNAAYIGALAELGDAMRGFGRKVDSKLDGMPDPAVWDDASKAEGKATAMARQLESNFNRTPEDIDVEVKRLIDEPIQRVHAILPDNPGQMMSQSANAAAAKLCRDFEQLKRKYPFNPASREDTTIDELNRYFAPGSGELAQFVQQPPFAQLLQRQGKVWIQNPAVAQPRLSPQFLSALSAQTQLSEMLYADGGAQPRFDYAVSLSDTAPIPFELESGGQSVRCSGQAPSSPVKFSWPDPGGGDAKLTLRSALTIQAVGRGVWGIFRLLGKAQERHGNQFVFSRLGFEGDSQLLQDAAGKAFTLQVNIDSKTPLFDDSFLSRLACSGRAVQ